MGITTTYEERNASRTKTMNEATMEFVAYFVGLGDDLETAQLKVSQLSTEVSQHLFPYTLGNTQPLIDAINSSNLPFMDANAKDKITGDLTNPL